MIIDSHTHCGNNRETKFYDIDEVVRHLDEANADGAVIFAFPEDMYRLTNTTEARIRANEYVLKVAMKETRKIIIPFYFVWNDYLIPDDLDRFKGIKWHRHADEPQYDYDSVECDRILAKIKELHLPVLIEEEFHHTVDFVRRMRENPIIIPHMGKLNGGAEKMDIFFEEKHVHFDTSVAPLGEIKRILSKVGPERVIFGSDVSGTRQPFFNYPRIELEKLAELQLTDADRSLILGENIRRLIEEQ